MTHASCYHVGYSLTCDEYDELLNRAAGRCMLCQLEPERFEIDHDHAIGNWAVRGLVCQPCNIRLRQIDNGRAVKMSRDRVYLAKAWHLSVDTSRKAARVLTRTTCPECGRDCAVHRNGNIFRHWSRLPGMSDTICGAALPKRPAVHPDARPDHD